MHAMSRYFGLITDWKRFYLFSNVLCLLHLVVPVFRCHVCVQNLLKVIIICVDVNFCDMVLGYSDHHVADFPRSHHIIVSEIDFWFERSV